MHFMALDAAGSLVGEEVFYSVGGGFIATEAEMKQPAVACDRLPHPFTNAVELMRTCCDATGLSVSGVMLANESAFRPEAETRARLDCDLDRHAGLCETRVRPGRHPARRPRRSNAARRRFTRISATPRKPLYQIR